MADANNEELAGLRNWYSQAGTPKLEVTCEHNPTAKTFTIHTKQSTRATAGQPSKAPVLIPLSVGLLGSDGHQLPLHLQVGTVLDAQASLRLDSCLGIVFPCLVSLPVVYNREHTHSPSPRQGGSYGILALFFVIWYI